jgi:hypothetical protein
LKTEAVPTRLRLTLYLLSIGIQPTLPGASTVALYAELDPTRRRLARRTGRRLARRAGGVANAIAMVKQLGVQDGTVSSSSPVAAPYRVRSRQQLFVHFSGLWSPLTPPCPSCRMSNGFPKRSWPSREWAAEVWTKQHDRKGLRVYACPVQPGCWHIGHFAYPIVFVIPE